jgi:hypothetical protein
MRSKTVEFNKIQASLVRERELLSDEGKKHNFHRNCFLFCQHKAYKRKKNGSANMDEEERAVVLVSQLIMPLGCVRVASTLAARFHPSLFRAARAPTQTRRDATLGTTISYALILVFMSAVVVVEKQGI